MINENIYLKYWEYYAGIYFDELEEQKKTIEKISRNSNITFKEVFK
jgi:hypothetical protein